MITKQSRALASPSSRWGWKALPRDREERDVASKQFREVALLRGASGSCRRGLHWIIAVLSIFLFASTSFAASDIVEIFYLPHGPAMAVVRDVEAVLKKHGSVNIVKYNFEDPGTRRVLEKYHIKNHMPVAVFINGRNAFVIGTRRVVFENFPKGNAFVPMYEGNWSYQDIESVLQAAARGK